MKKLPSTLYAWPFAAGDADSCDDGFTYDTAGFPVKATLSHDDLVLAHNKHLKVQGIETCTDTSEVGYWLVSKDTDKAARGVPLGEWGSQIMRNTAIRKQILKDGCLRKVLPVKAANKR